MQKSPIKMGGFGVPAMLGNLQIHSTKALDSKQRPPEETCSNVWLKLKN